MSNISEQDQLLNKYDDYLDATYSFKNVGGVFSNMEPSHILKTCDINLYNDSFNIWKNKPSEITKVMQSDKNFFTPGIFRAMQNEYKAGRKNSQTRKRAISTISTGYNIPDSEAEGILSGTIPATINDDAGTVSYITRE